jgi:hypothetical protein
MFMQSGVMTAADLDFIEELRLRRWARENYVPAGQRKRSWHPVIQQEMEKKDQEAHETTPAYVYAAK